MRAIHSASLVRGSPPSRGLILQFRKRYRLFPILSILCRVGLSWHSLLVSEFTLDRHGRPCASHPRRPASMISAKRKWCLLSDVYPKRAVFSWMAASSAAMTPLGAPIPNAMRALVGQTCRPDQPSAGERLKVADPDIRRRQRASHRRGRATLLLTNDGPWPYAKVAIRRLEMRFSSASKPLLSASPRKSSPIAPPAAS